MYIYIYIDVNIYTYLKKKRRRRTPKKRESIPKNIVLSNKNETTRVVVARVGEGGGPLIFDIKLTRARREKH